jgi:two-component system LytT family response regulator
MPDPRPLRAVIVDDEELARAVLREHLAAHPDVQVVAECVNGFEAIKAVSAHAPDLLLLDIQMPKLDGFEVLQLLDRDVAVIFVTAYDEHALRAFAVHAVDYLLKPFSAQRLGEALAQARQRVGRPAAVPPSRLAAAARRPGEWLARLIVRDGAQVHVIPAEAIDSIQAQDDYICIRAHGRRHLKQQTLAEIEGQLDPSRFVRIHRSWILNIDRLARLEPATRDSRTAVLRDGTQLPVSRAGHARLMELL